MTSSTLVMQVLSPPSRHWTAGPRLDGLVMNWTMDMALRLSRCGARLGLGLSSGNISKVYTLE